MKNIFISHSWTYDEHYEGLIDLLDSSRLDYRDYSVPKDDPIHRVDNARELREAIERQIKPCSCVLMLAGVYSTHSKWINEEIAISKRLEKPIIAVAPRGAEKISSVVKDASVEIVRWNTDSIVGAIRRWG